MSSETNNGMVKFTIGRPATMHGVKIDNVMGVNTWVAFAGSDDNAVVDGDFAVTEDELQPVLKAIRVGGINIVAIHSHMTHEQPRIMFFHYWGRGAAKDLAEASKVRFWLRLARRQSHLTADMPLEDNRSLAAQKQKTDYRESNPSEPRPRWRFVKEQNSRDRHDRCANRKNDRHS